MASAGAFCLIHVIEVYLKFSDRIQGISEIFTSNHSTSDY